MKETTRLFNIETGEKFNSIKAFLEYYNQHYYDKTSLWVEQQIDELLKQEMMSETDLLHIFAWKTNRINHNKSEETKSFVFTKGSGKTSAQWEINLEKKTATAVTRRVIRNIYPFLDFISNKLDKNLKSDDILKQIKEQAPYGIGTVYLITFLYFITCGDEPIYDVFAMAALDAIYPTDQDSPSLDLGSIVKQRTLPSKNDGGFKNLLNPEKTGRFRSKYIIYKEKLQKFMDEVKDERKKSGEEPIDYKDCRCFDRALWAYGHCFSLK